MMILGDLKGFRELLGPSQFTIFVPLPPLINFVHDHFFNNFQQNQQFKLGQVQILSGPSAEARTGYQGGGRALRLEQARGPSAAARQVRGPGAAATWSIMYMYVLHIRSFQVGVQKLFIKKLPNYYRCIKDIHDIIKFSGVVSSMEICIELVRGPVYLTGEDVECWVKISNTLGNTFLYYYQC